MCTVTFIPRVTGYYLAMNRDEKLTRVAGLPPERRILNGTAVICPSEPGGGTWISVNERQTSFALINWYSVDARVTRNPISRGEVVTEVSGAIDLDDGDAKLVSLPLHRINPFRLIGVFPNARKIAEWQWDLKRLVGKSHLWKSQQWISSGFDEPMAQRIRGETFQTAQKQQSAGTLAWLRRLHRSHSPHSGPFSTCMHRPDAATVSYTEIVAGPLRATMKHNADAPCCPGRAFVNRLARSKTTVHLAGGDTPDEAEEGGFHRARVTPAQEQHFVSARFPRLF